MAMADPQEGIVQHSFISPDQLSVRNILMATDLSECSERALSCALGVASRYQSRLHLFHCIDPIPYDMVDPGAVQTTRDDAKSELERLISGFRKQDRLKNVEVHIKVEAGDLAGIFPDIVKDLHPDLIVVGTHGRTGWRKMVLGSVAEIIVDQSSCPVLTVGPSADRPRMQEFGPQSILLANVAPTRSALAESYALSLARKYGSQLHTVDGREKEWSRVTANGLEYEAPETERRDATFDIALSGPQHSPADSGVQSDLILSVAHQIAADLIVLSVPGGHRFADRFLSTNPYRVLCDSPCPVLTVHAR
ncbi:MAG TPA: universal stress protein [Terriglobales bacterium]|nr:universal stress protein [Terriglobales bacterium]